LCVKSLEFRKAYIVTSNSALTLVVMITDQSKTNTRVRKLNTIILIPPYTIDTPVQVRPMLIIKIVC